MAAIAEFERRYQSAKTPPEPSLFPEPEEASI
jgi:hypothetical protein